MANELVGWRHFINWRFKLFLEAKTEEIVLEVDGDYFFTHIETEI
jgi:hypothetical protein